MNELKPSIKAFKVAEKIGKRLNQAWAFMEFKEPPNFSDLCLLSQETSHEMASQNYNLELPEYSQVVANRCIIKLKAEKWTDSVVWFIDESGWVTVQIEHHDEAVICAIIGEKDQAIAMVKPFEFEKSFWMDFDSYGPKHLKLLTDELAELGASNQQINEIKAECEPRIADNQARAKSRQLSAFEGDLVGLEDCLDWIPEHAEQEIIERIAKARIAVSVLHSEIDALLSTEFMKKYEELPF
jgi:hypothetical protein